MLKVLTVLLIVFLPISIWAANSLPGQTNEFSTIDGKQVMRSIIPGDGSTGILSQNRHPYRNPHIMAEVMWVDRNHENAIAQNVAITPDGSGIFAGWWLNNMRFAAYASAGLETPLWRYYEQTQWQMPVAACDTKYSGTSSTLPGYMWDKDSPLPANQINLGPAYSGGGTALSGDGSVAVFVFAEGQVNGILVACNTTTGDTILTRTFDLAQGIYGVDLSRDGTVAVVSCYNALYVYEIPNGTLRGTLYNYSQNIAKISSDGSLITIGTFSGDVYLYDWDGSEYGQRWIRPTHHSWVTALDISEDGSTVACGTMNIQGGQITGGKFMMWDAETGEVLIDYAEYGHEVASVALSATGEYAIAGSWGKYQATFGDVVTCFIRESDVPIFQLLDDIDEPGSIFSVAISDSGHYATAGGKAVHANEWGNGGMVYSIQVRDPLTHDVAVSSIDDPSEFITPGVSFTPTATFMNVGTAAASFAVSCSITNLEDNQVVYTSSSNITDLSSFVASQVFFSPGVTLPSDGRYRVSFAAEMVGDEDTSNNTLALISRSWHDMQAVSVASPFDEVTVNWSTTPIATFKNLGSYTETADVLVSIFDSLDTEVYSAINTIFELAPYAIEQLDFEGWAPSEVGLYRIQFSVQVADDYTPDNNTIIREFRVTNEMIYDDNISDMSIWVDAYPSSNNRKFATRFDPNITLPFTITNIRFYQPAITYSGYFDYIDINSEIDALPDTTSYLYRIENPVLPGPDNWASFDVDVNTEYQPLWVVLHWADVTDAGPYVGADNTPPIDGQSWWYSDNNPAGWSHWTASDWMIRMTLVEGGQGIGNEYVSGLPLEISLKQNYPNPFNPTTRIEFALPNAGNVNLEIYNCLGQKIRSLVDSYLEPGYHTAVWDGKTDLGLAVSSGMYYYRLTCGDYRISRKMTMLK
jgi:WD40 repeat protein